jgi:hypothetical protein
MFSEMIPQGLNVTFQHPCFGPAAESCTFFNDSLPHPAPGKKERQSAQATFVSSLASF